MSDGRVAGGAGGPSSAGSRPGGGRDGAGYEIRLLGGFEVRRGDQPVVFARGAESAAVKLLALHAGVWHRERLCEALWPGDPARAVGNRIRNVLSRARAQAPGLIARGLNPVEFEVPVRVDVAEFMRESAAAIRMAATDSRAALARGMAALDLYGGGLLPGDRYADWAHGPREHVTARHVVLLGMLADAAEAIGAAHLARLYRQQAAYGDGDAPPGW